MVFGAKLIAFLFFTTVLVTQYQNCSSYSDNTLFQNSLASQNALDSSAALATGATNVNFTVRNTQSDLYVAALETHIQIGGNCNPGGRLQNYFEYSLSPQNAGAVVVNPAGVTPAEKLRLIDARCENGKFYLVLPVLCPSEGGPVIFATSPAAVKIYFHTFDAYDSSGVPTNYKRVDQTVFVDLAPQGGCP